MHTQDYQTNFERGIDAARAALTLNSQLGMDHTSLGSGLWSTGRWEAAEREFEQALRLSPGYARAHQRYALLLYTTGRADEGVLRARRALELDPVSPQTSRNLGWALEAAGRLDDAIEQYHSTIELAPGWPGGWANLSAGLVKARRYDESLQAWATAARLEGVELEPAMEWQRAHIRYFETGEPQTVIGPPPLWMGLTASWWYAAIGQHDRAVAALEEQLGLGAKGSAVLHFIAMGTGRSIAADPRYRQLFEQIGIGWPP